MTYRPSTPIERLGWRADDVAAAMKNIAAAATAANVVIVAACATVRESCTSS